AKGLEFPVVILADPTTGIARTEGELYADGSRGLCAIRLLGCAPVELRERDSDERSRQHAEGIRVAYVAATRARDLLVIPAVGDEPFPNDGWLSPLNKAIYPTRANWRKSRAAPGCPDFGTATVLNRPLEYETGEEDSVKPGLIQPERGEHEVVWWDPSQLNLNVDGGFGLRQQKILHEDGGASLAAYREWQSERAGVLERGAKPEFEIVVASQATDSPPEVIPVTVEFAAESSARPGGRRFGTLVHAALRDVPLDASREAIAKIVAVAARSIGAPAEEIEAARAAVEAALAHPILKRARGAARMYREYPLTFALEDGKLLEGVIDLAFVEDDCWNIIDFKTDAANSERRGHYERQIQWYAYALTRLTGMPGKAWLLGL
ncbi:MAG: PD-(D/E)XK nuclease family protein, partial [Bryobacteraceae bacterium]